MYVVVRTDERGSVSVAHVRKDQARANDLAIEIIGEDEGETPTPEVLETLQTDGVYVTRNGVNVTVIEASTEE